ncbi:MAG: serine/threonine protein kinase [Ahniella sp.]|nr:serine/threonine protein kinase [Ahniella sp.]
MFPTEHPPYIGGFEILGEIGRGGMGVVYRARDPALQRELAIKLQIGNWEEHPDEMERFLRESRILAKINHPNVVQIYSVGTHDGAPFFAMELLERSVAESARLRMPNIAQLKRWMLDAARGLAAIHEMGVVHRDIKPANLLLTTPTSIESEHVKIADLGIASANDLFGGRLTQSGMVLGTTGYLAPEAWFPDTILDGRADQYALGVVYFELLTGRSPHQFNSDAEAISAMMAPPDAPDIRTLRTDIDEPTAELIARMLKTRPDDRYPSSPDLVQAMMATMATGMADYRIPTPRPIAAPNPEAKAEATRVRLEEGPTLARRRKHAAPVKRQWWAILLPAVLVLPALSWYFYSSARKLEPRVSAPESAVIEPNTPREPPTPPPPARSAWAEYLLGHYT